MKEGQGSGLDESSIISSIRKGENTLAFSKLYKSLFPGVRQYILKNNGTLEEAEDIFQDCLLLLYKYVKTNRLEEIKGINAFLFTVCKNNYINRLRTKNRNTFLSTSKEYRDEQETGYELMLTTEREKTIMELLALTGERCKDLLFATIYENLSMREICTKLGFSTEDAAKTKHYKCKQRLMEALKGKPHLVELLKR